MQNNLQAAYLYASSRQSLILLKQLNSIKSVNNFDLIWSRLIPSLQWPVVRIFQRIPSNSSDTFLWHSIMEHKISNSLLVNQSKLFRIYPAYTYFTMDNDDNSNCDNDNTNNDEDWCKWLCSKPCDYALQYSFDNTLPVDPLVLMIRQSIQQRYDGYDPNLILKYPGLRLLSKSSKVNPCDVTIYDLLNRFSIINVERYFIWQEGNLFGTNENSSTFDAWFPFSNDNNVKNQQEHSIDYRYLFGQDRPLTSFAHFLALSTDEQDPTQQTTQKNSLPLIDRRLNRLKHFLITSCQTDLKRFLSSVVLYDMFNDDPFYIRLYASIMKILKLTSQEDLTSISLKLLFSTANLNSLNSIKQIILFNIFSQAYSLQYVPTILSYYAEHSLWFEMLFTAQLFQYSVDDMISCFTQTTKHTMLLEHMKCCFKRLVKQNATPVYKQDIFALLTDETLTSEQLKLRFQQGIQFISYL